MASPDKSAKLLVQLDKKDVAMFRFLLEGYDNLACFTVLDKYKCLVKVMFDGRNASSVIKALNSIGQTIKMRIMDWPV